MRRTASAERAGMTVEDPWGGRWQVRCTRAGVRPAPAVVPPDDAVRRLLLPWGAPTADPPPPAPAASWVLGRSARWQGVDAVGAGADPVRDEALTLRNSTGVVGPLLSALALRLWVRRAQRTAEQERDHPWLVQLGSAGGPARSVVWTVTGPVAAAAAVPVVVDAVRAGRFPELPDAQLVEVRDHRC